VLTRFGDLGGGLGDGEEEGPARSMSSGGRAVREGVQDAAAGVGRGGPAAAGFPVQPRTSTTPWTPSSTRSYRTSAAAAAEKHGVLHAHRQRVAGQSEDPFHHEMAQVSFELVLHYKSSRHLFVWLISRTFSASEQCFFSQQINEQYFQL
jgi:hypothetical protein